MAATITVTTDSAYSRFGVTLAGFAAADGAITVKRVHPDGTEWTVRSIILLSGGTAFGWDPEIPFGRSVYYYAYDGSTRVQSSTVSYTSTQAMMRSPGLPSLDAVFEVLAKPEVGYVRPTAVLRPLGRTTVVPLSTSRFAGDFTLTVETHSDTEANALLACVTQSLTCLLLLPGTRSGQDWSYVAVQDVRELPFAPSLLRTTDGDAGTWAQWQITCSVAPYPIGGVMGDPTASYASHAGRYASYAARLLAHPGATYLDRLKGLT